MTDAARARELAEIRRNVDRSYEQDAERARLSYTEHTASALHRRAVAATNGQSDLVVSAKCFPECQCHGEGMVERGPSGATFSYPCYPWDCHVVGCRCKSGVGDGG